MMDNLQYIDKFVILSLVDKTFVSGECVTVDPVTKSFVLICNEENKFKVTIIIAHAIVSINNIPEPPNVFKSQEFIKFKDVLMNKIGSNSSGTFEIISEKTLQRRDTLLRWLEKNHLPVIVTDNVLSVVNGIISIEPPYKVECCRGTNTVVLDRIMKMIKSCPGLD